MDAAPEKKTVRVNIFNQSYSLVTTGDGADVEALAHRVDELMMSIARGSNADQSRIAVLACLHMADELRSAEQKLEALRAASQAKHLELARLLDRTL